MTTFIFCFQIIYPQVSVENKDLRKFEGFFDYFYDQKDDKIYLLVQATEEEFLYVHSLSQGIGSNDIGIDRGQLGDGVVRTKIGRESTL